MKKLFAMLAVLLVASFCSFAEIVSWKGMEMGSPQNPKWLKPYLQKKDERALRKKFELSASERIVLGVATDETLEVARTYSQMDAQRQLTEAKTSANGPAQTARLEFVYEFWQEDSEKGYTVYSLYTM